MEAAQAANAAPIGDVDDALSAPDKNDEVQEPLLAEQLDGSSGDAVPEQPVVTTETEVSTEVKMEENVVMKTDDENRMVDATLACDESAATTAVEVQTPTDSSAQQEMDTIENKNNDIKDDDATNATDVISIQESINETISEHVDSSEETNMKELTVPEKIEMDLVKTTQIQETNQSEDNVDDQTPSACLEVNEAEEDDRMSLAEPNVSSLPVYHDTMQELSVDTVPHRDDEYDPANPSPAATPTASIGFTEQKEYDPDHPLLASSASRSNPEKVKLNNLSSNDGGGEQVTVVPAKRKAEEDLNVQENGDADSKRHRAHEDNSSSHSDEQRHGNSTPSSSSKHKDVKEDHKGLSEAAWDRLMDFQASGEFRVTQVSRAAFASVGAMPEFAQIAIIARFVRTPMKDVRDKNGQLMRLYREYQKENPQVAALQPVDVFISDYKSDPGLFRFGYAPPQPATGMSSVKVPYHREDTTAKSSPRPGRGSGVRSETERKKSKDVDEFGRSVHADKSTASKTGERPHSQRTAGENQSRSHETPSSPHSLSREDPRRREPHPESTSGTARDPRRRGSTKQQSPRGTQSGSSDLFDRLSPPVKAVVETMRREGRLQEPLNDNVVTRLLHLPERVALQAVENFSNVDLSQVENLQGFLVGIINRVNEKAIASEKQHRPLVPSPRGQHPSRGVAYGASQQGGSVLGGPPQGGRLTNNNGPDSYRGQPGPASAGFERPYDTQDSRDPRRRQPDGPPQNGGPSPATAGLAPIGMQSFSMLPISVQNHLHSLVANRTLSSLEELGGKCYKVLGQLSEPLANHVLTRFAGANLSNVRNRSGFLIGVVKRARQEYGFN